MNNAMYSNKMIYNGHNSNFHTKIMHVRSTGVGVKEASIFTHTHTHTRTHTHCKKHGLSECASAQVPPPPHTPSKDKQERELWASKKEVHLESRPETMNQACLPDVPGQGIPLGRGTSGHAALFYSPWAPGTSRNDLLPKHREPRWNELR